MNYNTLAFLTSEDIQAVTCVFEDSYFNNINQKSNGKPKTYTYKTVIKDLKVDDLVIVECTGGSGNHGFAVVKVVELDSEIDFQDQSINYRWIVDKLDTSTLDNILHTEKLLIKQIKQQERKQKTDKMRDILGLTDNTELVKFQITNVKI